LWRLFGNWGIYLALPTLCPCPPALVGLCLSNPINIYIKNQGLPLHLLPFLQYWISLSRHIHTPTSIYFISYLWIYYYYYYYYITLSWHFYPLTTLWC
jgi:hypothetical protein